MATYTNPSSLLTPTDFKLTGAAAGAFDSIKNAYAFSDMDAGIRDQDLGYLSQLNKYQNQIADQPLIDLERQNKISAEQMNKEDWDTGVNREVYRTAKQTGIEVQKAQQSAARLSQALEGATVYSDVAQLITAAQESGMLSMQDNPEFQKHYDYYKQRAKAAGTPLPDNPFDPAQQQLIMNRATAAMRSLPEMQKRKAAMDKMIDEFTYKTDPKIQSAERIAEGRNATAQALAQQKYQFQKTVDAAAIAVLNKEGPITETDIPILRLKFANDFDDTPVGKNPEMAYIMSKKSDPIAQQAKSADEFRTLKKEEFISNEISKAVEQHNTGKATAPVKSRSGLDLRKPTAPAPNTPPVRGVTGKIGGQTVADSNENEGEYKGVSYIRRPDLEAAGWTIGMKDGRIGYLPPNK